MDSIFGIYCARAWKRVGYRWFLLLYCSFFDNNVCDPNDDNSINSRNNFNTPTAPRTPESVSYQSGWVWCLLPFRSLTSPPIGDARRMWFLKTVAVCNLIWFVRQAIRRVFCDWWMMNVYDLCVDAADTSSGWPLWKHYTCFTMYVLYLELYLTLYIWIMYGRLLKKYFWKLCALLFIRMFFDSHLLVDGFYHFEKHHTMTQVERPGNQVYTCVIGVWLAVFFARFLS